MFSSRRHFTPHYSTKQCQEMMKKQFGEFVNQHIMNQDQQELVENYSLALQKDRDKQVTIKEKLNASFFNQHKQRRSLKQQLRNQFTLSQNQNQQIRNKLTEQLKTSLTFTNTSRKKNVKTPQPSKHRYRGSDQTQINFQRPCSNRSSFQSSCYDTPISRKDQVTKYSLQIDNIIDQSNRVHSKTLLKRRHVITPSERKNQVMKEEKTQKESIIHKIIANDVDQFLKSYSVQVNEFNPQTKRKIYEEKRKKQLRNFDKYNMSFTSYMKQKTKRNIDNSIYNDKIRQKDSYVQKFQRYILDQFKFSEEAKRRLEKIFKAIQLQYKRPVRNRQISQRLTPK